MFLRVFFLFQNVNDTNYVFVALKYASASLVVGLAHCLFSLPIPIFRSHLPYPFTIPIFQALFSSYQDTFYIILQSLLMVFIQLIRFQLEMTLEFLSIVPGPTGKAALDYILTEWCSRQNTFYGAYERKAR